MKQIDTRLYVAKPELKDLIKMQGRRHAWVAAQAGVSKFHFSHVMAGRRGLTIDQAEAAAQALGVPLFLVFELLDSSELLTHSKTRAA